MNHSFARPKAHLARLFQRRLYESLARTNDQSEKNFVVDWLMASIFNYFLSRRSFNFADYIWTRSKTGALNLACNRHIEQTQTNPTPFFLVLTEKAKERATCPDTEQELKRRFSSNEDYSIPPYRTDSDSNPITVRVKDNQIISFVNLSLAFVQLRLSLSEQKWSNCFSALNSSA